jgi:hypothetical protein
MGAMCMDKHIQFNMGHYELKTLRILVLPHSAANWCHST